MTALAIAYIIASTFGLLVHGFVHRHGEGIDEDPFEVPAKPIFNFFRLVASKTTENKGMHETVLGIMQQVFGRSMINATLKESSVHSSARKRA